MRLGPDQLRSWDSDGFLILERLIDEAAVETLRRAYDEILERRVVAGGDRMLGGITRQVMMACMAHPAFERNDALDEAAEIVEQLCEARPVRSAIPLETIQFWVALDDVDEANGCMHFLPGHHKRPLDVGSPAPRLHLQPRAVARLREGQRRAARAARALARSPRQPGCGGVGVAARGAVHQRHVERDAALRGALARGRHRAHGCMGRAARARSEGRPGLSDLRHGAPVPGDAAGGRARRSAGATRALVRDGSGAARRALLRDGARPGPGAARHLALHVRPELAEPGDAGAARAPPGELGRAARGAPSHRAARGALRIPALDAARRDAAPPLRRFVAEQRAFYDWVSADGIRSLLIERCFAWLDAHWPRHEAPTVLSWGDSRIGNILYRDFEPVAVLDWEMAALGPPELDLGWMIALHRFFDDLTQQAGMPGMPDFLRRDDLAASYEKQTGHAPRDLDFYTLLAALRHGIVMFRIARRAVHFGEATLPADVDDMVSHRRMLERKLAGEYW